MHSQPKFMEKAPPRFSGSLLLQQVHTQDEASSEGSFASNEEQEHQLGDLKAFTKQIGLKEMWPALSKFVLADQRFDSAEARTVRGFASIISITDLTQALGGNVPQAQLFLSELHAELKNEAEVDELLK